MKHLSQPELALKIFLCVVTSLSMAIAGLGQSGPDLILVNGRVFTADASMPSAQAVAISGDRILAVGATDDVRKLAGERTRIIDLGGRTVVPGFNDSHAHFGPIFKGVDLQFTSMDPGWSEASAAIGAAVSKAPAGKWIFGTIGESMINDANVGRDSLDKISPENPVLLSAFWGHGAIFNSAAIKALGLTDRGQRDFGGRVDRDAAGRLTGRMYEYPHWKITHSFVEQATDEQLIAELKKLAGEAASLGITSMQIMPAISTARFVRLLEKADLPIRVRAIAMPMTSGSRRDIAELRSHSRLKTNSSKIIASGVKWIIDGTPIERGAAVRSAYLDKLEGKGSMNFSDREIENMVRESLKFDQQLLIHAVGDRAVEVLLKTMEKVTAGKDGWPSKRVRIEHGEGVTGDLLEQAKKLGVIVVQNPSHFSFVDYIHSRWGQDTGLVNQRSFLESGLPYAIGSDGPINPFLNVMFAVTHPSRPSEAITREQAVAAYTSGSAFAEFAEKEKGTITKGKLADLVVLSQDIFAVPVPALPGTTSVLTVVGGTVVHDAGVFK